MLPPRAARLLLFLALALLPAPGQGGGHPRERSHLELFTRPVQQRLQAGVFLRANTTLLAASGDWLELSWSGVADPRHDDLLALFPEGADPNATAPIKYRRAADAPAHLSLGAGTLRFRLLNARRPLRFAFVRGGLGSPVVAAWTASVSFASWNEPTQGHLIVMGNSSEMRVQWVSADRGSPVVRWGAAPGRLTRSAPADSATYSRSEMCGPPANAAGWFEPGQLHSAVMTGLQPGARVYYQFGDEALELWSEEASFLALPAPGPGTSVSLLAVADLGQAEVDGSFEVGEMRAARDTAALMAAEAHRHQLLVHNGDISYARGYGSQWESYFHQMGPLLTRLPYLTAVGNHERDWPGSGDRFPAQYDSGGECGVPYYRRTQMPAASEDRPWFSLDVGPIHFLQYSTEHAFHPGSEQHAFMSSDLAGVDRRRTPWVIVGGHRPMYIDSVFYEGPPDGDGFVAGQLRAALEPLLHRYRVDATWHGHHHSYQRTCPVYAGRCQVREEGGATGGAVHLVIGHGGAGLSPNVHLRRPAVFEAVQLRHGFMRVTANATHMEHQVVSTPQGDIMDSFTLTKPPGWVYAPREVPHSQGAAALYDDDNLPAASVS